MTTKTQEKYEKIAIRNLFKLGILQALKEQEEELNEERVDEVIETMQEMREQMNKRLRAQKQKFEKDISASRLQEEDRGSDICTCITCKNCREKMWGSDENNKIYDEEVQEK